MTIAASLETSCEHRVYYRKGRSMVRNSGSQLRDSPSVLLDTELALHVGLALMAELGATRRATKTVMRWTGVSDRTARFWLHGQSSPSGVHLIALAAACPAVMKVLLRLTGNADLEIGVRLREIEDSLEQALVVIRSSRRTEPVNAARSG
jgi:hypothetical protein